MMTPVAPMGTGFWPAAAPCNQAAKWWRPITAYVQSEEMLMIPSTVREVIDRGPFRDDWSSLADYQVPAWYQDGSSASSCIGVRTACRCSAMSGIPAICTCRAARSTSTLPAAALTDSPPDRWPSRSSRGDRVGTADTSAWHDRFRPAAERIEDLLGPDDT